ncbi:uncharacterized protein LOC135094637 [Scylla paramamosain]|uniref:uncharacterized protein LOC135094637 n=1 Tax=Scylla paramamosain TaxID=85552 RepID=UPI003082FFE6
MVAADNDGITKIKSCLYYYQYGDREASELWSHLQLKIPQYFSGVEVFPSLLHGDLWSGNTAEMADGPAPRPIQATSHPCSSSYEVKWNRQQDIPCRRGSR